MIRAPTLADSPALSTLLADVFGRHPDQDAMLGRWLEDASLRPLVAVQGDRLVGASVVSVGDPALDAYTGFGVDLAAWAAGHTVGVFRLVAVHPDARRAGLAAALSRAQAAWLLDQGVDRLLGVSWDSGSPASSRPLFEGAGFDLLGVSADFYARQQARTGQPCAHCGVPCACRARLYGADAAALQAAVGR